MRVHRAEILRQTSEKLEFLFKSRLAGRPVDGPLWGMEMGDSPIFARFESVCRVGGSPAESDYSLYSEKSAYFHKLQGLDVR